VGRPDLYISTPSGVTPGVKGTYAKTDPDKRSLDYTKLKQTKAKSAGG